MNVILQVTMNIWWHKPRFGRFLLALMLHLPLLHWLLIQFPLLCDHELGRFEHFGSNAVVVRISSFWAHRWSHLLKLVKILPLLKRIHDDGVHCADCLAGLVQQILSLFYLHQNRPIQTDCTRMPNNWFIICIICAFDGNVQLSSGLHLIRCQNHLFGV